LGLGNAAALGAGGAFALNPQPPASDVEMAQQQAQFLAIELGRRDDDILGHPPAEEIEGHPAGYPDQRDEVPDGLAGFPITNDDELTSGRLETPVAQPGGQNPAIITPFPAFNLAQQYYNKNASADSGDVFGQQAVRSGKLDEKAKT